VSRKTRLAVIGLGMAVKPHAQSLIDLKDRVDVAAAFSPSAERRAAFAKQYPFTLADNLDAIAADRSIDAVMILTPPTTHLDLVKKFAGAGKHILLEKPIEVTVARAQEAVEACERADVKFGVVFQHRFRPGALALTKLVASGALGKLLSASASIRWWRSTEYFAQPGRGIKARDGGGVLITQAVHTLDLFLSLTGPAAEVTGFAKTSGLRKIDTEDVAAGAIRFVNGALGSVDATTVSYPGFPEKIELACENATAILEVGKLDVYYKDGRKESVGELAGGGGGADPMAFTNDAHRGVLADFLDAIDKDIEPKANGHSAMHVHRLIEGLLRSSEMGRPVKLS
jgi:UDP-N-acetyl-2-amino-2-deoxyglucuronate dehydrogenase